MNVALVQLAARIRQEADAIERVVARAEAAWRRAQSSGDDYYLDAVALNVHGFYSGWERVFERIAEVIDGGAPHGEHWHRILLDQMTVERAGVRPAVLSSSVREAMEPFRAFRHVARRIYSFDLDPEKIRPLVAGLRGCDEALRREVLAFADFLEQAAAG